MDPTVAGSHMPLALALVAGALASVNPRALPPEFLTFYVGADHDVLRRINSDSEED